MGPTPDDAEAARLEELWAGDFGDAYVERNLDAYAARARFWRAAMADTPSERVLEVGANVGGNLQWIAESNGAGSHCGVDVNVRALETLRARVPQVAGVRAVGRALPFSRGSFDLVFTMGVLIHQPDSTLNAVMDEMVRCSRRWVLCGEYYAPDTEEVVYRGHEGALFRRDYGKLFLVDRPSLRLDATGHLGRDDGFDDITWWRFERR